ncbi:hypothetical protein LguiA_005314 [Lonicera macranthoides]
MDCFTPGHDPIRHIGVCGCHGNTSRALKTGNLEQFGFGFGFAIKRKWEDRGGFAQTQAVRQFTGSVISAEGFGFAIAGPYNNLQLLICPSNSEYEVSKHVPG